MEEGPKLGVAEAKRNLVGKVHNGFTQVTEPQVAGGPGRQHLVSGENGTTKAQCQVIVCLVQEEARERQRENYKYCECGEGRKTAWAEP